MKYCCTVNLNGFLLRLIVTMDTAYLTQISVEVQTMLIVGSNATVMIESSLGFNLIFTCNHVLCLRDSWIITFYNEKNKLQHVITRRENIS